MSSIIAFGNIFLTLGLVQLLRWGLGGPHRASPFRTWIRTSQAWGGWAILAAVAVYILTLLAVEAFV